MRTVTSGKSKVGVGVIVGVGVMVGVGVIVSVLVAEGVNVGVGVGEAVFVWVGENEAVGVRLGVGVEVPKSENGALQPAIARAKHTAIAMPDPRKLILFRREVRSTTPPPSVDKNFHRIVSTTPIDPQ
jgi:hypothetical protein